MAIVPYSLVGMLTSTTGTGTMTLTSAIAGHSSLADAGVSDAEQVPYLIKAGDDRELGIGTVGGSGTTLTRDTVTRSIISGTVGTTKMTLTGTEQVYLTVRDADLAELMAFSQAFTLPTSDGTADQVLKTNGSGVLAFADAGGGGAWVPISKATASVTAAVDIALTGGYSAYCLRLSKVQPATDGVDLWIRTSEDSGSSYDSGASDYKYSNTYRTVSSGTPIANNSTGAAQIVPKPPDGVLGNNTAEEITGELWIYPGDGTFYTTMRWDFVARGRLATPGLTYGMATREDVTRITHIRFLMSSGNIGVGDFHLYGMEEGA